MDISKIKGLLEKLQVDVTDETTREKVDDVLKELNDSSDGSSNKSNSTISKSTARKVAEVIGVIFLKFAEHEVISFILKELRL
jgi:hypothetical protein